MNNNCPVYKNNSCILKENLSKNILCNLFEISSKSNFVDCKGLIENCSFVEKKELAQETIEETTAENTKQDQNNNLFATKVSIHKYDNPYLIKSDVLVYPTNIVLTIDDDVLYKMSKGLIQQELDKIPKPIKMGTVYITSSGDSTTKVQSKKVFHAVVSGESRLVNEADIKSAIRKSLHLANNGNCKNIVMLPPDCGTHDINDTARVHLSAVKTFLQTQTCHIKNIFIVMSDQESYEVYEQYYNRIFK